MALFGQGRPQIGSGWAALGETLGNLDEIGEAAYRAQINRNYDTMGRRERAGNERLQREARSGITAAAFIEAGYSPEQAQLLANVVAAGGTPDLGNVGKLQVPTAGAAYRDADAAMRAGDVPRHNELLAIAAGKPYQPVQRFGETFIADGAGLPDIAAPGGLFTTPLGDARAAQALASANLSNTKAASGGSRTAGDARPDWEVARENASNDRDRRMVEVMRANPAFDAPLGQSSAPQETAPLGAALGDVSGVHIIDPAIPASMQVRPPARTSAAGKRIARSGMYDGRRVYQFEDGTVGYGD